MLCRRALAASLKSILKRESGVCVLEGQPCVQGNDVGANKGAFAVALNPKRRLLTMLSHTSKYIYTLLHTETN